MRLKLKLKLKYFLGWVLTAANSRSHHWFTREITAETPHWWRVITQKWRVVVLTGSASDWLKICLIKSECKHYPDLGSETTSVWFFLLVFQTSFRRGTSEGVAKRGLLSYAREPKQRRRWRHWNFTTSTWTPLNLSNVGDFSGGWIPKAFIRLKKRNENSSSYVHILRKTAH